MKSFPGKPIFLLAVFLLLNCLALRAQSTASNAPLTNAAVVKLVKAGFKEKSIITIISSRAVSFDLSTDRLIELKRKGVSEKLLLAMMARQEGLEFSEEEWANDESFFDRSPNPATGPAKTENPNDGSTADIFGSSGGSQGSTKTRGGSGSSSGDVVTTGSATVRILRGPSEAGTPAKLEKTASLTNESIIDLVQAGFSEGTIIRRIEQSPVEFDLSPGKLIHLRKQRVSDKILAAMRTAMGGDADAGNSPPSNVP